MVKQITVNGQAEQVTNTLSCGPGCEPSTYELTRGAYVYAVGSSWYLQERGQFARKVAVEKGA
jgi:hypothetical protein